MLYLGAPGPPGSLSSILRVVCPAAHQYTRHARPCSLSLPLPRSCSALSLSHTLLFWSYTTYILFLSRPFASAHSVEAAATALPLNRTKMLSRLPPMLLKPPLTLKRLLPTPPKWKPELTVSRARWRAEGRLELDLGHRWKWRLAKVDVKWHLDRLWPLSCSRRILGDHRENLWALFRRMYDICDSWTWFCKMYYDHLNTRYCCLLILDRTASQSSFILYNACIINNWKRTTILGANIATCTNGTSWGNHK